MTVHNDGVLPSPFDLLGISSIEVCVRRNESKLSFGAFKRECHVLEFEPMMTELLDLVNSAVNRIEN